jgi:hypothetical protein
MVQYLGRRTDGISVGKQVTDTVSLYGVTPVAQRASALQATSQISLTTFMTINTNVAAFCLEVANTLQALGVWKGAA